MRSASRLGSCACSSSCASVTVPENLAGLRPIPRAAGIRARIAAREGDRLGQRPYCNEESGKSGCHYSHPSLLELPQIPGETLRRPLPRRIDIGQSRAFYCGYLISAQARRAVLSSAVGLRNFSCAATMSPTRSYDMNISARPGIRPAAVRDACFLLAVSRKRSHPARCCCSGSARQCRLVALPDGNDQRTRVRQEPVRTRPRRSPTFDLGQHPIADGEVSVSTPGHRPRSANL